MSYLVYLNIFKALKIFNILNLNVLNVNSKFNS